MDTFVTIIGWIAIVLAIMTGLCAMAWAAFSVFESLMRWLYGKAYIQAQQELGRMVNSSAHWFAEDSATVCALQALADRLLMDRGFYAGFATEEWRKEWRDKFNKYRAPNRLEHKP